VKAGVFSCGKVRVFPTGFCGYCSVNDVMHAEVRSSGRSCEPSSCRPEPQDATENDLDRHRESQIFEYRKLR